MAHDITTLLLAWGQGDQSALERLMSTVEKELRGLARGYLRREGGRHLLQTTALVNEAYIKLVDQKHVHWKNRSHFFAIAAMCMRRVLLDHIRAEKRQKRGGGVEHVRLSDALLISDEKSAELLALDEALQKLSKQDARKSHVIEMYYFGGYGLEEIAGFLDVSKETVERDARLARAWLRRALSADQSRHGT